MRNYVFVCFLLFWTASIARADEHPTIRGMAWRPDGSMLAVSTTSGVILLDNTFQPVAILDAETSYNVFWNHSGSELAVLHDSCELHVWEIDTQTLVAQLPICGMVEWSANDRWLDVLTQDQQLMLVDLTQPAIVSSLPEDISAAAWHPTLDRLVIAYPDMRVQIRDVASNTVILERFAAGQQVAWSADGSEFVTVIESGTVLTTTEGGYQMPLPAYSAILFWDAQTGQIQHSIELPQQISLKTIDFVTPTLIGGYCTEYNEVYWSDQACVWDRTTGEFAHRYSIAGGSSSLGGMAWSPDGRYLSAVTVWHTLWTDIFPVADAGSEDYVDEIDSINGVWLAWTPDSRYLTATDGASILQYDVETQTTQTITLN